MCSPVVNTSALDYSDSTIPDPLSVPRVSGLLTEAMLPLPGLTENLHHKHVLFGVAGERTAVSFQLIPRPSHGTRVEVNLSICTHLPHQSHQQAVINPPITPLLHFPQWLTVVNPPITPSFTSGSG